MVMFSRSSIGAIRALCGCKVIMSQYPAWCSQGNNGNVTFLSTCHVPGAPLTMSHVLTSFNCHTRSIGMHPYHLHFMDGENEAQRTEIHAQGYDSSLSLMS